MSGLERAIALLGTQAALARALGVHRMVVSQWTRRGVPAERVIQIERATGGQVTRHQLRPDLYPLDEPVTDRAA